MAIAFLDKIFSLFSQANDPESVKKKLLKQLTKELTQNKYARFYKIKTEEIEPPLGKFFFDMYKIAAPAQIIMQNAVKSAQLKQSVVEAFMDKKLLEIQARLSPEVIEENAKKTVPKELSKRLKEDIAALSGAFDTAQISAVDRCYNLILAFAQFVTYDFFFLLRKFDPNIPERNLNYQPRFEHIRAEYISEDLKDFLDVSFAVDPDQDWKTALKALKAYRNNVDVVSPEAWNKLLVFLRDVRKSNIMELMIRHIDKNPVWQSSPKLPDEHIVEAWLEIKRSEAEEAIDKIVNAKRNAQIDLLAKNVFGSADVIRLKYYTPQAGEIYTKKNFDGFLHVQGLNYLKAFTLDYFKKDIRELCDLLLIRGQWSNMALSQQMSEGFHSILNISEKLLAFDEALSDSGENGFRLKASIVKADRDKSQAKYVRIILKTVNNSAMEMINSSSAALIAIGKNLKNILDDAQKSPHELIINWKELDVISETPLAQRISGIYKKIYYFVQLMQLFARPIEEE
jgi:hypothetical protein